MCPMLYVAICLTSSDWSVLLKYSVSSWNQNIPSINVAMTTRLASTPMMALKENIEDETE